MYVSNINLALHKSATPVYVQPDESCCNFRMCQRLVHYVHYCSIHRPDTPLMFQRPQTSFPAPALTTIHRRQNTVPDRHSTTLINTRAREITR